MQFSSEASEEYAGAMPSERTDHNRKRPDNACVRIMDMPEGRDQDRNAGFDQLQGKMKQLDDRVSASHDHTSKRFDIVSADVLELEKTVRAERIKFQEFVKEKQDDVARSDTDLHASILREQKARRDAEVRILHSFESKTNMIRDECNKVGTIRRDNENNLRRYLEVDVPRLYESLKEEAVQREAMEEKMIKKTMEEVEHLQGSIIEEKKARENTEEAMLRMMEDVVAKMQQELANERHEREKTEEMLMGLLNATCKKLMAASEAL